MDNSVEYRSLPISEVAINELFKHNDNYYILRRKYPDNSALAMMVTFYYNDRGDSLPTIMSEVTKTFKSDIQVLSQGHNMVLVPAQDTTKFVFSEEEFVQYLSQNSNAHVGIKRDQYECPIANFLKSKGKQHVNVNCRVVSFQEPNFGKAVVVNTTRKIESFILTCDSIGEQVRLTGAECLVIWNRA